MATDTSPRSCLEIKGLNVHYGSSHAVQNASIVLDTAKPLSIVGRNGMGKTTLCNAIMGLLPVTSGSLEFHGVDITSRSPNDRAKLGIGYVPQGRRLFRSLSTDEHLRLVANPKANDKWTVERIYDIFPRLKERRTHLGDELSGGEKQMLAIGRALLLNPDLLVMDEPTEGLAPVIVEQVVTLLQKLSADGIALLIIEQNLQVALQVADHVGIMVNGAIVEYLPSATLATDPDLQQRHLGIGVNNSSTQPETAKAS